jgi:hypothetical protein
VTPGLEIKQSASDVPYDADSTPLPGLPWSASAAGSRARGHGAGYSAGTSACPLPRLSPRCLWHRDPTRHPMPVGHACPHEAPVGSVSRWLTGAAPGRSARIAAVSPTFGRLYEGTDRRSPGQTWAIRPTPRARSFTDVTPATDAPSNLWKAFPNVAERLALSGKTVNFGQCRFRPWNGARQRSRDGRSASWPTNLVGCLERRSRVPPAVSCCGVVAVLSTPVDNHVDSSSSPQTIARRRSYQGGTRR